MIKKKKKKFQNNKTSKRKTIYFSWNHFTVTVERQTDGWTDGQTAGVWTPHENMEDKALL